MDEEWKLYRQYLGDPHPDEETIFLAEESLKAMIDGYYDEFDRQVARYNLADIYIKTGHFDLARTLIREIQNSSDPLDVDGLLRDLKIAEEGRYEQ